MGNKHVYQQLSGNSKLHAKFYYETVKVINSTWLGDMSITFNQFMHDISIPFLKLIIQPIYAWCINQFSFRSSLFERHIRNILFYFTYCCTTLLITHCNLYSCLLSLSEVVIRWYSYDIYPIYTRINQFSNRSYYLLGAHLTS